MGGGMWIVGDGVEVLVAVGGEGWKRLPRWNGSGNRIGVESRRFVDVVMRRVRIGGRCCLQRDLLRHDKTVDEVVCECDSVVYCQTWQSTDLMTVDRRKYSVDSGRERMKFEVPKNVRESY
jgi:hypothetical protein